MNSVICVTLHYIQYMKNCVISQKVQVSLTEDEFVEEVQGSGVLVYLSATWLRELYQQVLANDLLKDTPISDHPLVHLLSGELHALTLFVVLITEYLSYCKEIISPQ